VGNPRRAFFDFVTFTPMKNQPHRLKFATLFVLLIIAASVHAQVRKPRQSVSQSTLIKIVKAEDERRWDGDLRILLTDQNPAVRSRAALAAGRIGNEGAIAELANMLANDKEQSVRAMAAFAIGD
jgi:HEAT repeat protein